MPSPDNRNSLPFEPKKSKKTKKAPKQTQTKTTTSVTPQKNTVKPTKSVKSTKKGNDCQNGSSLKEIPEVVSKRMVRRMALFSGIPTGLGIFSFIAFYVVVTQGWFKVPNTAVLLCSAGLFGLGVLGLSYSVLSTSWDEERVGTWWGWSEFTLNFGRLTSAWKNSK